MKKVLVCFTLLLMILCACSQQEINVHAMEQKPNAAGNNVKAISDLSSYSYIGEGSVSEDFKSPGTGKMKMLGIKKHTGEAAVVHFVNEDGNVLPNDPFITASLTCDSFSFYKISFTSSDYFGEDFATASGDIYCLNNIDGSIYKMEGITAINTGFGEYDCYNNVFVGSFKFSDGKTKLCKVYVKDKELKVEEKVDLADFPEFQHVFMDAKENIFAYDTTYMNNYCHFNWVFPVNYVLSNKDKIYKIPGLGWFLGYNRVVYKETNYRLMDGKPDLANSVRSIKEELSKWVWNETKARLDTIEVSNLSKYDISTRPDGKKQYIRKEDNNVLVEYYTDIEFADIPTSDFLPPELTVQSWNSAHQGPCKDWGYSTVLFKSDNKCYYLTKVYTGNSRNEHYITKVTFLNDEHTKYEFEISIDQSGNSISYDTVGDFVFTDKQIFFMENSVLKVIDYDTLSTNTVSNQGIVKYHSIEKADNNEVAFVGTNTSAERMYYKINTDTLEITLIGSKPTFSSVSFHSIEVTM